jgi:hypothetical protein
MREQLSTVSIVLFVTMLLIPVTVINKPLDTEKFENRYNENLTVCTVSPVFEVVASSNSKSFNDNLKGKLDLKNEKTLLDREEYQTMPSKNMNENYTLIKQSIDESSYILYNGEPNEKQEEFLYEIAIVESRLGYLTTRYTTGGRKGKGVWQMERGAFNATKDIKRYPQLIPYLDNLKRETGIDWREDVKWDDCNYVFYGAVAAHLYLIVKDIDAKNTTAKRAVQWKKHYNTYKGKGRASDYIRKVEKQNNMVAANI